MTIRDYVKRELIDLESGTPVLLTTQACELESMERDDPKREEVRSYLLKWGGMQEGGSFGGFSEGGECAYPYALGEIFRLGHLSEAWGNRPNLVPVSKVDDKGLSYMLLEEEPKGLLVGREAILTGVQGNDLVEYKPLLEELL